MTSNVQRRGWMPSMRWRAARVAWTFSVVLGVQLVVTQFAHSQTFSVLYSFTGAADGATPWAPLIQDGAGNLYGTTSVGGDSNFGVVFKVTP
jgi:uncharacterized repeat protein (TIGR03803 family)